MPLQENSRRCLNAVRCGTILHEVFLEVAMPNFHRIIRNIRMGWSASRLKNGLSDFTVLDNFLESASSQAAATGSYDFMDAYLKSSPFFRWCFKSYIQDMILETELDNIEDFFVSPARVYSDLFINGMIFAAFDLF